ncbi:hypothetical protein [Corynebacterium lehmanniae]|uniref:Secreted protein n=1 Tax=Corynebacterium lehmanniae TaxID=2913497 RepID=A0ABT4R5G9_9CORY|nr:hypothetical protein [Corynebacterium lehmanniae]MCZ9290802.1 hypothetical protein [Corynebacterium lehmanniae]
MKRIITSAAACAIALGAVAAPAHAATVGEKDADGNCAVTLTDMEKEFITDTLDESKQIGEHERARDVAAAVETVYPGVMAANESDLKGEAPDYSTILPADLIKPYTEALRTLDETEPTTATTLEDVDTDAWKVGPSTAPMAEAPFTEGTELYEAWSATPSGMLSMNQQLIDVANASAAASCAKGDAKDMAYPTGPIALDKTKPGMDKDKPGKDGMEPGDKGSSDMDGKDSPNVAAIVGGVIAALLALAGIAAALPMLGIHVPGMNMPRM